MNTFQYKKGELLDGIRLKNNINNIGENSVNDINNISNIRPNNNLANIGINLVNKALNPKFDVKKKVGIIHKKDMPIEDNDMEMK